MKAFPEAESYDGPSLIIAYSHCIAHGIDMATAMAHQKDAVGLRLLAALPLRPAGRALRSSSTPGRRRSRSRDFTSKENRFSMLTRSNPGEAAELGAEEQHDVDERWRLYEQLATVDHDLPAARRAR